MAADRVPPPPAPSLSTSAPSFGRTLRSFGYAAAGHPLQALGEITPPLP